MARLDLFVMCLRIKCFNSLAEGGKDETKMAGALIPDGPLFARTENDRGVGQREA